MTPYDRPIPALERYSAISFHILPVPLYSPTVPLPFPYRLRTRAPIFLLRGTIKAEARCYIRCFKYKKDMTTTANKTRSLALVAGADAALVAAACMIPAASHLTAAPL